MYKLVKMHNCRLYFPHIRSRFIMDAYDTIDYNFRNKNKILPQ